MDAPTEDLEELTGVWYGPGGIRIEFAYDGSRWRARTYPTKRSRMPGGEHQFDTAQQVRDAIQRLEATGHTRQVGTAPSQPLTLGEDIARQWQSPKQVIGALLLLIALLVIGIPVISSCS